MFIKCFENIIDTFKISKTEKIPYCLLTIIYIDRPKHITTKHKIPPKKKTLILLAIILLIVLKVL
jgi:hypothetical protein